MIDKVKAALKYVWDLMGEGVEVSVIWIEDHPQVSFWIGLGLFIWAFAATVN